MQKRLPLLPVKCPEFRHNEKVVCLMGSVSCGPGGSQSRLRKHVQENGIFGSPCGGQDEQVISCSSDPCDELIEDGETTTFSANPEQVHLGSLRNYHHGISGEVYRLGQRRIRIEDFHYDGLGPDAFIWIGTQTSRPGDNGTLLPYPFTGEFYHYTDPEAPVLGRFNGQTLDLTLPPQVEANDIKWVSVWCRKFRVNFGDLILNSNELEEEKKEEREEQAQPVQASPRPNIFDPRLRTTSPASTISVSTTTRRISFSRPTLNPNLPELPRRINSQKRPSFGQLFKSKKEDKEKESNEVDGKDPVPFTVIRVSSSVSQVRQESNELDDDEQIALPFIVETTTSEAERVKSETVEPTSDTTATATTSNTSSSTSGNPSTAPSVSQTTTSKRLFGPRKPFLRPVAKFQDIKIPSLEPKNRNNADSPLIFRPIGDKRTSFKRPTSAPITTASTSEATESSVRKFTRVPIRNTVSFLVRNATTFSVVTKSSFSESGESTTIVTPIPSSTELPSTISIASDEFRTSSLAPSSTTARSISRSTESANEFRPTVKSGEAEAAIVEETTLSRGISTTQEVVTANEDEEEDSATPPSETVLPSDVEDEALTTIPITSTTATTTTTTTTGKPFNRRITIKPFVGRERSRFKGLNTIKKLLEKRKQFLNKVRASTTPSSITKSVNRFRTTLKKVSSQASKKEAEEEQREEENVEEKVKDDKEAPISPFSRRPLISRFRPTAKPEASTFSTSVRVSRFRTTRAPFEVEIITKVVPDSASTVRISDNERLRIVTDFMKKDKEEVKENQVPPPSTADQTDANEFKEETRTISDHSEKRKGVVVKVPKKIDWNPVKTAAAAAANLNELNDDNDKSTKIKVISTEPLFVTPPPPGLISDDGTSYNPCSITDACGPNAECTPRANEPLCTCPRGFSGIPRDGIPDPAHGCVRTPEKCTVKYDVDSCSNGQSCVRELCLPQCELDTECSLGERCVNGNCIKICFYDAHCLAGEFCEKSGLNSTNGVCLAGCQRDTNCPFGQICISDELRGKRCEEGCHFNNDCGMNHACINGSCDDPCADFDECGSNALCEVINHVATCKCPPAFRELNSPYVA
ncbi:hypothetical protein TCAL_11630, partial [Tigriopus californicus]|eukprot:TCALIF_11630-PA protein Name:"Similar to Skeletor Protein Skeletor, isoforms D/E (Drosophila melanogaster)" AED:0.29 eAED:0.29 QI:0/0.5/0.2/0.6/1/1/5/12/1094